MLDQLVDQLNKLPPQIAGAIMASFIAVVRVIYDANETKPMRIFLEAVLCGALSLVAGSAIKALGLNVNWILFMGGCIGYLGSTTIKTMAIKFIGRKIGKS